MSVTRLTRLFSLAATFAACTAMSAQAAFIVGAHSSEKANASNFSYGGDTTSASASTASAAVGLTGTNSIFGGNGSTTDTYVFSYTPGTNADNTAFTAGDILGSTTGFPGQGNVATGATGGGSGLYNVYFTAPASTNVNAAGSNFTLTQNGPNLVVGPINQNNGGTGPDTDPGPAFVGGANNAWFKLGTVNLVAGNTYSVTMEAVAPTFVSQRAHAVMWEAVPIPEPATFVLAGMGLVGMALVGRRRMA